MPAGYCFGRVPGITTERAGTRPLWTTSCGPLTSMMCVEAVMTTFAPSTASSSTSTPSTRMQRLPMNAPSSTMFGRAPGGSSTPPIPTPPARWTFAPICAQEPTVAQVSTIDPDPTRAPMFTKPGMSTTPGSRCEPNRATPPGTTRTPAFSRSSLSGILSRTSKGPNSAVSIPDTAKKRFTACMSQACTFHSLPTFSATRSSPRSRPCSAWITAARWTGSASFVRSAKAASMRRFTSS
jgi:hypothetical protein